VPNIRLETINVDFVVKLYESVGFNMIITVVDSVSKRAHFILIHTIVTIEDAAKLFLYYIWKLYCLHNCIIFKRELQIIVLFTKELYYLLRVKIAIFIAWHP